MGVLKGALENWQKMWLHMNYTAWLGGAWRACMHTLKTEAPTHDLNQSATATSQQTLQAHQSNPQNIAWTKSPAAALQSAMEVPITLGISLYCDHECRSHKLATLLSHASWSGSPYQRVKQRTTLISKGAQENMEKHVGNYVPRGVL